MIKPIETIYNGYRFRSRLEARWAVFFDTLGVKWEYEKEGFDLDGTLYLPDFWLPDLKCWVEIKGQEPTEEERLKIEKLAGLTQKESILIYGNPYLGEYKIDGYNFTGEFEECVFAICRRCPGIWIKALNGEYWGSLNCDPDCTSDKSPTEDHDTLIEAYTAARQARFEHGEKGNNTRNDVWPQVTNSDGSKVYIHPSMYRLLTRRHTHDI